MDYTEFLKRLKERVREIEYDHLTELRQIILQRQKRIREVRKLK